MTNAVKLKKKSVGKNKKIVSNKGGYLKEKLVYLAGPIHDVADDGVTWREDITPRLEKLGIVVTDPTKKTIYGEVGDDKGKFEKLSKEGKFDELKDAFWPVIRKDLRMVDHADFLIAVYSPNVKMLGTIHELVIAQNERKPILIYCDKEESRNINPWITAFVKGDHFFTDWDKMIKHLENIDKGNFDHNFWTL